MTTMLTIVGGPMFAGKTTWLINFAKTAPPNSFQAFKPSLDTRYAEHETVTHNGDRLKVLNLDTKAPVFPELPPQIKTVLIDELNFFSFDHLWPAVQMQLAKGLNVIGVGLLYDSEQQPFGSTLPLSKKADEFIQLHAICDGCGQPAQHSYRKIVSEDQVILGAAELYGACCQECWAELRPAT